MRIRKEIVVVDLPAWTEDYDLDPDCGGVGTDLCWKFANEGGCSRCYVGTLKSKEAQQQACERWDETIELIPPDIEELASSKTCWFCEEKPPEKADGYAVLEMANPEPYSEKPMFFGIGKKVRTPVGSLLTLNVAVCGRCRRAFRMVDIIQVVCLLAFLGAAVAMLVVPAIAQPMADVFVLLPVIFLVLMVGAGYGLGRSLSTAYMKRKSKEVNFNVGSIPIIRQMLHRDWYFFQTNHGIPRMNFTRVRTQAQLVPPSEGDENAAE